MNLGDPVSFKVLKREHTRLLLSKYSLKEVAQILEMDPSSLYRYRREEQIEHIVPPPPPRPPAQEAPPPAEKEKGALLTIDAQKPGEPAQAG